MDVTLASDAPMPLPLMPFLSPISLSKNDDTMKTDTCLPFSNLA